MMIAHVTAILSLQMLGMGWLPLVSILRLQELQPRALALIAVTVGPPLERNHSRGEFFVRLYSSCLQFRCRSWARLFLFHLFDARRVVRLIPLIVQVQGVVLHDRDGPCQK